MTTDIVIYHNPECGTSRNALAMIRNAGIEPHVIEYLKTPPSRALLADTGAGGRLTTWRATRLASCSAASWGLETLSPPGAAAAARIGKTGVCTRTGAATAWCSGARRA